MEILKRNNNRRTFVDNSGNTVSARYQRYDKNAKHQTVIVDKTTTLDILALKNYGTPLLYWVLADFNDILDPMKDIPAGTTIKVPVLI